MPVYGLPNAVAHTAPNVVTNANANGCANTGANVGTDVESDKRAKLVADDKPDTCAHTRTHTVADAAAAHPLCAERVWQMGTMLEVVWRWAAAEEAIHRDGAGAWRKEVWQVIPVTGL